MLCGPVSSSVMVDTCSDTRLAVSCQQLRTHSTTDTDIYLHTTARVRVLGDTVLQMIHRFLNRFSQFTEKAPNGAF